MYFYFWIPASIAEVAAVIPNGAKTFFVKGITTYINGPANLLNNDPENPRGWIILKIWDLESFKSVDILLLKAFLNFVFVLLFLVLTAVFSFFSCVSENLTFTLLYSTIYTNY